MLEMHVYHTSTIWGYAVIHKHEVLGILVPLGDDDRLYDILQV